MFTDEQLTAAGQVLDACRERGLMLATAESCTGGLIAGCLTAVAGSSDVIDRGFVTYTNEAKSELLGVAPELLETKGAVSEDVARAMAGGALKNSAAQISVAVTGIAGPGGGTAEKPIGLVHIACARNDGKILHGCHQFDGDREAVRSQTVLAALKLLKKLAE